jgi:hypothetical protein
MSAKVMGAVWDADLPRDQKFILLAYADHAEHDGSNIYPSVPKIAWKTGYSERQVQRITKELIDAKIMVKMGDSHLGTHLYRINLKALPQREEFVSQRRGRPNNGDNMSPISEDNGDIPAINGDILAENGDIAVSPDSSFNTSIKPSKDSGAEAPSAPKESKKRERDTRLDHPAILLVRGVTNAYPPKASFAFVIDKLGATPDGPKFATAYQTWCTRGNKPTNLEGIIDWYINGVPPQYKPAYGKAGTPAPANQPEADYTAEREAIKKATIAKRLAAREGQNANAQASPQ